MKLKYRGGLDALKTNARKLAKKLVFLLAVIVFITSVITLLSLKAYATEGTAIDDALGGIGSDLSSVVESDTFPFSLLGENLTTEETTNTIRIVILLTVLALAPSILIMMTGFVRIIIVLSFVRNAMGTQQMPPNQAVVGLALFLTFFVMQPVFSTINENALKPYYAEEITFEEMLVETVNPIRYFMFEQIRLQGNEQDLNTFIGLSSIERPSELSDIPTHVLIPGFIVSEIKTAFKIGFLLYIPFIVIDMVVASALMSMGMMMLPPSMISLPFKIMLFVLVDGWNLIVQNIIGTFRP